MTITAAAKSNHDQLFGDHVSTLAQTDPELIEYFDNLAFGEVYADATRLDQTLDLHAQVMVQLAAILAAGGNTREKLLAVLTVLVPFIGYPRTLNGLAALNDITRS